MNALISIQVIGTWIGQLQAACVCISEINICIRHSAHYEVIDRLPCNWCSRNVRKAVFRATLRPIYGPLKTQLRYA